MSKQQKTQREQDEITKELRKIRGKIEELHLPESSYAGVEVHNDTLHVARIGGENVTFDKKILGTEDSHTQIIDWFRSQARKKNLKFVAVGISGTGNITSLGARLWLEEDIVPYIIETHEGAPQKNAAALAREVESRFNELNIAKIRFGDHNEVLPDHLVTLENYQETTTNQEFDQLRKLANEFSGKTIRFFSATPRGGGVALMRHALIRLFQLLDVDAHWHVMQERAEVFEVTKTKFHNVLQAVSDPDTKLTDEDKEIYESWIKDNVEEFRPVIKNSDVIVIDDPQPSGMMPYIREINPEIPILYRSHIQLIAELANTPKTPQNITWQYLWNNIKKSNVFIAHPIDAFIPKEIPRKKTITMPATTDPLDGLNKPLKREQKQYYLKLFNKVLIEHHQEPLDTERPYIIQIARFDPSKGISDVLESYQKLRERLTKGDEVPQLVIVGHGSVDDPDGVPVYNLTMEMLQKDEYKEIAEDIKVARLHHTDQLLNVLMREAKIGLQLSHKEGFEIKVTEGLMKGVPMIAYKDAGGIHLQITHKKGGYLVDEIGDTDAVAEYMHLLCRDKERYAQMSKDAKEHARRDVLTVPNAIRWLSIALNILEDGSISKRRKTQDQVGVMGYIREKMNRVLSVL